MSTCLCDISIEGHDCITQPIICDPLESVDCECSGEECYCSGPDCKPVEPIPCYNPSSADCECDENGLNCICIGSDCIIIKPPCFYGDACVCTDTTTCFCENIDECQLTPRPCRPIANDGCECKGNKCFCYTEECEDLPEAPQFCIDNPSSFQCQSFDEECWFPENEIPQKCFDANDSPCAGPSNTGCLTDELPCRDEQCTNNDVKCDTLVAAPLWCYPDYIEPPKPEEPVDNTIIIILVIAVIFIVMCFIFLTGTIRYTSIGVVVIGTASYIYFK